MIKVIQVLTDTNIGGAGIWLLNFLKTYNRDKIDMAVILPENSLLKERIEEIDVRVIEISGIADSSFSINGIKALHSVFAKEKPDIVHTHASLSARIAAKISGISVVHTRHCLELPKKHLKKVIYGFLNNLLSDRVIGVSNAVCENLVADGINRKKLRMVYNGIFPLKEISEEEKSKVREKYNIPQNCITVGIVARLEPVKNHFVFLEAAKAAAAVCHNAVFVIVGTGSMENALREFAKKNGIDDRVIFTGYINDVNDIMNVIDLHVLTSEREALSISLIEAMSISKPVIATNSGGPAEVVENKVSGVLVETGDALNLAMGMIRFIQRPDFRKAAGEAGKKIVLEKFLAETMAKKIEEIYNELKS